MHGPMSVKWNDIYKLGANKLIRKPRHPLTSRLCLMSSMDMAVLQNLR
jgi:hypothetical protein